MLQHGEEILQLYGKLEKLTRIDLRYISENDLPIPISYVIEMREEYENQRTFWKNWIKKLRICRSIVISNMKQETLYAL